MLTSRVHGSFAARSLGAVRALSTAGDGKDKQKFRSAEWWGINDKNGFLYRR